MTTASARLGQQTHAEEPSPSATLAPFQRQQTVLLTTFRRDGTAVGTPVSIAVDGDEAYFRTWDSSGKFKRLRNASEVAIASSTARGAPTGPAIRGRARLLSGEDSKTAARLLARKHPILHGILVPLLHRLRGNRTVHFAVTPLAASPPRTTAV
jgi:PPOX class probable F420-dependent enzyme